jgi:hypothetical protein
MTDTITVGTIGEIGTDADGNLTATTDNPQTATTLDSALTQANQPTRVSEVQSDTGSGQGYVPKFSEKTRTVIYIAVAVVTVAIAPALTLLGLPEWSAWLASAAGGLGSAFGIVYNPLRMATK